jgi:hypothetical protein
MELPDDDDDENETAISVVKTDDDVAVVSGFQVDLSAPLPRSSSGGSIKADEHAPGGAIVGQSSSQNSGGRNSASYGDGDLGSGDDDNIDAADGDDGEEGENGDGDGDDGEGEESGAYQFTGDVEGDWTQYTDEASGAPYWFNQLTGESAWELPAGAGAGASASAGGMNGSLSHSVNHSHSGGLFNNGPSASHSQGLSASLSIDKIAPDSANNGRSSGGYTIEL